MYFFYEPSMYRYFHFLYVCMLVFQDHLYCKTSFVLQRMYDIAKYPFILTMHCKQRLQSYISNLVRNMNITIQYIDDIVGEDALNHFLRIITMNKFVLWNIIPWLSTIIVMTNMVVALLSATIYIKTKRENHKPAFVFIGTLALADVFLGGQNCGFDNLWCQVSFISGVHW